MNKSRFGNIFEAKGKIQEDLNKIYVQIQKDGFSTVTIA